MNYNLAYLHHYRSDSYAKRERRLQDFCKQPSYHIDGMVANNVPPLVSHSGFSSIIN